MRVIVTGGAGFIGSHVCERLVARGDEVVAIDNFDPFYDPAVKHANLAGLAESGRFRLVEADIADAAAVEAGLGGDEIDAIVHLAARAGVRPSLDDPRAYVRTNVEGTTAMLELARRRGLRAFVNGSSSSVYGETSTVPFTESDPATRPISPYAATKRAAELMAHTYAHLFGLSIISLRLFTVYGPRQRPDLAIHKFTRLMAGGREIPFFGDGSTARDYTYVDDVVSGITAGVDWARAAEPGEHEIVNLGGSRTTTLARLVELIAGALGVDPRLEFLPMQPGDVPRTYANVDKARLLLGYDPRTPVEDGIPRFVEWFRAQGG